jgi:phosphoribosyl 1,2-cyclic phosphate phosphodiesterase
MIKITFLGTGTSQGIPVIGSTHSVCLSANPKDKRLRSSVLIETENLSFTIDCGPDFRQQMLKAQCERLDGILFTHEHADHTAGIDDIRPYFFKQGDIPVFASSRVIKSLKKRFGYIFNSENKYPGAPSVKISEIDKRSSFQLDVLKITPVEVMHNRLSVLGYRIGDFAYLTDVKTIASEEMEKLNDLDVLVLNCLRIESHPTHLNLEEALEIIDELKPKKTYFTHISHYLGFHDEADAKLPDNVFLAYDTLQVTSN